MADRRAKDFEELERQRELVRRCSVSRSQRRAAAEQLRNWYETGTDGLPRARYNKLHPHIDRVGSFVFAPQTVRFGGHLPKAVRKPWLGALAVARDETQSAWEDAAVDSVASMLLEWALVYGATIAKVQRDPQTGFRVEYTQPWDFGVAQEDVPSLDKQNVMCHWYSLGIPDVERWVRGEEGAARLLALAREHERRGRAAPSMHRLVVASVTGIFPSGTISAGFPMAPPESLAERPSASVDEPTVEFVDCWERRLVRRFRPDGGDPDVFEDWWVTTLIADSQQKFTARRNPDLPWMRTPHGILPASNPFVVMAPRPLPDYLWGRPELSDLRLLQLMLEDHVADIKRMIKLKLDPSKAYIGVADWEEAAAALGSPGGGAAFPDTAKVQPFDVTLGQEPFEWLRNILGFFADASGIPESLQEPGSLPGGIRATGHFAMAAGVSAGRVRKMALTVEQTLGDIATLGFRHLQRHDANAYERPDGPPFLLENIPASASFRVDAHSSSPIFAEQTQAKAVMLKRMDAIGSEDAVELIDPPHREELKVKAAERDKAKAEHAREILAIQAAKAERSGRPVSRRPA